MSEQSTIEHSDGDNESMVEYDIRLVTKHWRSEKNRIMRISNLEKPFYGYKKTEKLSNIMKSAPFKYDADFFSFTGTKKLSEKISIIPSANPTPLEKNIEEQLGVKHTETEIKKFANGETYINIRGRVKGKDVYLMPATNTNVNDNLMETYLKADAAKRAGAKQVIAIMPNFDYARQERRNESGEPIAAKLNMDLLKTSGVDGIITTDLHSEAIEGFAGNNFQVTHLKSMQTVKNYLEKKNIPNLTIVSPDIGGTKRAEKLADALNCEKAIIHKKRQAHNEAKSVYIIGNVQGKNCVIYDDIIDTAGTISEAARMLKEHGANDIYVCASHGLFNGNAIERLSNDCIKEVIVTNTTPFKQPLDKKFQQVNISLEITGAILDISA